MNNESNVTTTQNQAMTVGDAMAKAGISASDLVIPKLLLMQNTSEMVGEDKAKMGDIINSQNEEVVGGIGTPLEIVPLEMFKTLRVYDASGNQPKFLRQEPLTAENEKLPWEGTEAGIPVKRMTCFNFSVLLRSELEAGEAFPYVLTFKSTGIYAGKTLATHILKRLILNQAPYSQSVALTVSKEKKETNFYAVFGIGKGTNIPAELQEKAATWVGALSKHRVDDSDEAEVSTPKGKAPTIIGAEETNFRV